jgi:hypothetical protein
LPSFSAPRLFAESVAPLQPALGAFEETPAHKPIAPSLIHLPPGIAGFFLVALSRNSIKQQASRSPHLRLDLISIIYGSKCFDSSLLVYEILNSVLRNSSKWTLKYKNNNKNRNNIFEKMFGECPF